MLWWAGHNRSIHFHTVQRKGSTISNTTHCVEPPDCPVVVFLGLGSPLDFLEWKKSVKRFHVTHSNNEERWIISYQTKLTSGMAKEMVLQMRTRAHIVKMLTDRYSKKNGLVQRLRIMSQPLYPNCSTCCT